MVKNLYCYRLEVTNLFCITAEYETAASSLTSIIYCDTEDRDAKRYSQTYSSQIVKISKECLLKLSPERRMQLVSQMKQALRVVEFNQLCQNKPLNKKEHSYAF